jgi:uncharacterized RDD family membrane protein YckC
MHSGEIHAIGRRVKNTCTWERGKKYMYLGENYRGEITCSMRVFGRHVIKIHVIGMSAAISIYRSVSCAVVITFIFVFMYTVM